MDACSDIRMELAVVAVMVALLASWMVQQLVGKLVRVEVDELGNWMVALMVQSMVVS